LPPSAIPPIGTTIPSPLQYQYRTKITPHFDLPSLSSKKRKAGTTVGEDGKPEWLKMGFNKMGFGREVLDIEVRKISFSRCI
jgi:tRNA (uracil-5-)-methyltransferase